MPKLFLLIFSLLFFTLSSSALAQNYALQMQRISTDEGLTQGSVTKIVQDDLGFIWIGTYQGLNRYDGYQVAPFAGEYILDQRQKDKKIKTRINKSFRSYNRTRTFELLESRIKFLTANQYIIGDIDRTKLKSGIYYNYPLITTRHQLRKLDNYYQELLKSNRPHMLKALKMIKKHNKKEGKKKQTRYERLKKLSFTFGYEKRVMNSFNRKMSRKIKGCW